MTEPIDPPDAYLDDLEYDPNTVYPSTPEKLVQYFFFNRYVLLETCVDPSTPGVSNAKLIEDKVLAILSHRNKPIKIYNEYRGLNWGPVWYRHDRRTGVHKQLEGELNQNQNYSVLTSILRMCYWLPNGDITVCEYGRGKEEQDDDEEEEEEEEEEEQEKELDRFTLRIFSNTTAARTMHRLLMGEVRLRPTHILRWEDDGAKQSDTNYPREWARVKTEFLGNGKYYRFTIYHENDHTVRAAFRKVDNAPWEQISLGDLPAIEPLRTMEYQLWRDRDLHMYLEDLRTSNTYIMTERQDRLIDGLPLEHDRVGDILGSQQGQWRMISLLHENADHDPIVSLYACVSKDGLIVDNVIVKRFPWPDKGEVESARKNLQDSSSMMKLAALTAEHEDMINEEIDLHQKLTDDGDNFTIRLRGVSVRGQDLDPLKKYRAYIEFAPKGDLAMLLSDFMDLHSHPLPEPFIWILFRNLGRACLSIERNNYVHLDIKPENIFILEHETGQEYSAYVTPVLGDFGVIMKLDENIQTGAGTNGFLAPEQLPADRRNPDEADPKQKPEKLHVFAIALLVWSVMRSKVSGLYDKNGHNHPELNRPMQLPFPGEVGMPFRNTENLEFYTAKLETLVRRCLALDISMRPTLEKVLEEIEGGLEAWNNRIPGLKNMTQQDLPEEYRIETRPDFYRSGTTIGQARDAIDAYWAEVEGSRRRLSEEA